MRFSYCTSLQNLDEELCDLLEDLCEGYVIASIRIIESDPDAFPCCIACGKFLHFPADLLRCPVNGPRGIVERGGGHALELACFQAAQRRRDGKESYVCVDLENEGKLKIYVKTAGKLKDPLADTVGEGAESCGCGI